MLAREGMRCLWLPGLDQVLEAARMARFDALVLDASALDGRDGATLARLRDALQCALVVLADRGDEVDEIVALELGADAYLLRPVAPRRLRAHLAVLLRLRGRLTAAPRPLAANAADNVKDAPTNATDAWQLDRIGNRLRRNETDVALTEIQSALLQCLFEAQGRIVPRERLAAALPLGQTVHSRSMDVYIHRLRRRLNMAGAVELLIEAVRGRGYLLRVQGG